MRSIILTVFATSLIAASTVQMASAAEHHARKASRDSFRGSYNQLIMPSQGERNIENFGFGGWDPSRVGGEDPSLKPSGS